MANIGLYCTMGHATLFFQWMPQWWLITSVRTSLAKIQQCWLHAWNGCKNIFQFFIWCDTLL